MERRVRVEHVPHFRCTGKGFYRGKPSSPAKPCKACDTTGAAGIAFIRAIDERWSGRRDAEDWRIMSEDDLDEVLEFFVDCIYGRPKARLDQKRAKSAQALTILQHVVDRDAARSVAQLGGTDALWNWLCGERRRHLRSAKPKDFTW